MSDPYIRISTGAAVPVLIIFKDGIFKNSVYVLHCKIFGIDRNGSGEIYLKNALKNALIGPS